jgi:hypothetical protein
MKVSHKVSHNQSKPWLTFPWLTFHGLLSSRGREVGRQAIITRAISLHVGPMEYPVSLHVAVVMSVVIMLRLAAGERAGMSAEGENRRRSGEASTQSQVREGE